MLTVDTTVDYAMGEKKLSLEKRVVCSFIGVVYADRHRQQVPVYGAGHSPKALQNPSLT